MLYRFRRRAQDEKGLTMIELLVVILVIGVLAAIAVPSFLNHKTQASDASAKELVHTAQTTVETVATDSGGDYTAVSTTSLHSAEPSIPIASGAEAWLDAASGTTTGYSVETTSVPAGNTFMISSAGGVITRSCTGTTGGCVNGTW